MCLLYLALLRRNVMLTSRCILSGNSSSPFILVLWVERMILLKSWRCWAVSRSLLYAGVFQFVCDGMSSINVCPGSRSSFLQQFFLGFALMVAFEAVFVDGRKIDEEPVGKAVLSRPDCLILSAGLET